MRFATYLAAAFILLAPAAEAQQWNSAEQEVISFTGRCWDLWQQEQTQQYFAQCWHEDITFWWAGWLMPAGMSWIRENSQFFFGNGGGSTPALDFQPHSVKVFGNSAVIAYQLLGVDVINDGNPAWWGTGRTEFLIRQNGAWRVVAVHQHAAPQNPYNE